MSIFTPIGYIYLITNTVNGKQYVGKTIQKPQKRFNHHKWASKQNKKQAIHKAISKHGFENFVFEVKAIYPQIDLKEKEIFWIDTLETYAKGYNETKGGDGCHGRNITNITKQKISRGNAGKKRTEVFKEDCRIRMLQNNPMKGKTHSIEAKEKIRKANKEYYKNNDGYWKGKNLSIEIREKISKTRIEKEIPAWNKGIERTPIERENITKGIKEEAEKYKKSFIIIDEFYKIRKNGNKVYFYKIQCENCSFEKSTYQYRYNNKNGIYVCNNCRKLSKVIQ